MTNENQGAPVEPRAPSRSTRISRFSDFVGQHERIFNVLSTSVTAAFTVVLATSTVFLWKETKDLRDFAQQQGEDMRASIAEATRSADAMRDVAKALATESEVARANLRAYITTGLGGVVPQNRDTNYRFEVRLTLQNSGNTPTYKVATNLYADVLPVSLPSDFKMPAFNPSVANEATVGPHQSMILGVVAPRLYSDDEVNEIEHGGKQLLYVFGTITYQDSFGANRYAKICQQVLWLTGGAQMIRNYGSYNEAN